jgi:hypothetical protein
LHKFNPHHNEQGRFTTPAGAVDPGAATPGGSTREGNTRPGSPATDSRVASNDSNTPKAETDSAIDAPTPGTPNQSTDALQTPSGLRYNDKISRQMQSRGWTDGQIDEAVTSGQQIDAVNKSNGNPSTRYVSPSTGRSVVIDNMTNEVIQVGGDGFSYGPASGDLPGAELRTQPSEMPEASRPFNDGGRGGEGGGGGGSPSDPFGWRPHGLPIQEEPLD